ncbi:18584_t:CDS:2 [Dentiscutata erythropus]|uniref:18584_t:CDS:1 n=1 Tax=Dentiscutata erythropus TaxID=1348616 RepID=A0A9N9ENM8_9GLOM|nr:18584_t:CDS:2 [Dentiscutata erythropus]
MKFVKQLVDCQRISFPPGVLCKGTSKDNKDYVLKIWGRCAIYHKPKEGKYCKCSLSVKEDISKCTFCKRSCIEKRKKELLDEEDTGPFIFGKFRVLESSSDDTANKLNEIRLDNEYKKQKIIDNLSVGSTNIDIISNLEDIPTSYVDTYSGLKALSKDLEKLKNRVEHIPEKKFYPKNFLFYGDSGSGKTSLIQKISKVLAKGKDICKKANDSKYFDEYNNQEVICKQELSHDTWKFQDLLNLCEKDEYIIKQRNKKPIEVVSKYNIFTAQDLFDDIFSFKKYFFDNRVHVKRCWNDMLMERLIMVLPGWNLINQFAEDITLEEAKKYIYDDDFENLYEHDGDVFMKREIDMNVNSDLPSNIIIPDNIESLHKNLHQKLHWVDIKPINFIENNIELIVLEPQIESSTKRKLDDTEIEDREKEKHVKLD